jgi:hypothetical protein
VTASALARPTAGGGGVIKLSMRIVETLHKQQKPPELIKEDNKYCAKQIKYDYKI